MLHCIYKIENKINGKCYIGQTSNFQRRLYNHNANVRNNKNLPLYDAIRRYGAKNFSVKVIDKDRKTRHIDACERYYIRKYNSLYPNGYNLESGGHNNKVLSKDHKRKISENHVGMSGKIHSQESKTKMSESAKGRKHTKSTRLKISENNFNKRNDLRTPESINAIKILYDKHKNYSYVARVFDTSDVTISRILKENSDDNSTS